MSGTANRFAVVAFLACTLLVAACTGMSGQDTTAEKTNAQLAEAMYARLARDGGPTPDDVAAARGLSRALVCGSHGILRRNKADFDGGIQCFP